MTANKKGIALVFVLIVLVALAGVTLGFWSMTDSGLRLAGAELATAQAFYLAEAGHDKARYMLAAGGGTVPYTETNTSLGPGTYTVSAVYADPPTNSLVTITSDGYVPNSASPIARRTFIEKNASIGGTNLSLAATKSSSGNPGGHPPQDAADGNQSTYCQLNGSSNRWLQLDYGSAKTVSKVVLSGLNITTCVIQYSSNGSKWTNVSGASGTLPGTKTFTAVTQRYLRALVSGANNLMRINEFESYSSSGSGSLGKGPVTTSR